MLLQDLALKKESDTVCRILFSLHKSVPLLCRARLLPMPVQHLLSTIWSGLMVAEAKTFCPCWALGIAEKDWSLKIVDRMQTEISSSGEIAEGVAIATIEFGMTHVHIGQSHVQSLIALNLSDFQSEFPSTSKI